jgi:hypothetical protein
MDGAGIFPAKEETIVSQGPRIKYDVVIDIRLQWLQWNKAHCLRVGPLDASRYFGLDGKERLNNLMIDWVGEGKDYWRIGADFSVSIEAVKVHPHTFPCTCQDGQ